MRLHIQFKLMVFARQNMKREKFWKKYKDEFDDYGQALYECKLVRLKHKENKMYKCRKDGEPYPVCSDRVGTDDFGIKQYVEQRAGYCEDDYYGTVWRKSLIPGIYIENPFEC